MKPIDYSLSFIFGKSPVNVRFLVDSRIRFIDEKAGIVEDYYQAASCKSERMFEESDLFNEDNYDFIPVFGAKHSIIYRRKAYLNEGYKKCYESENLWNGQAYRIVEARKSAALDTDEAILRATHDGWPLVAQTEIANEELGLRAIIEYPVKTMNFVDADTRYQVDTGILLLPDLTRRYERFVDSVSLAYVVYNTDSFAEFVIEQPTAIEQDGKEVCRVYHYSGLKRLSAKNTFYAIHS